MLPYHQWLYQQYQASAMTPSSSGGGYGGAAPYPSLYPENQQVGNPSGPPPVRYDTQVGGYPDPYGAYGAAQPVPLAPPPSYPPINYVPGSTYVPHGRIA